MGHYGPDAAPAIDPLAAALADEYLARLPHRPPGPPPTAQAAESPNELLRNTARHAINRIELAPE